MRNLIPGLLILCMFSACTRQHDTSLPVTVTPAASLETRSRAAGWGDRSWLDQHQDGSHYMHGHDVYLVLLGDSITQSFGGGGRSTSQAGATILAEALPGKAIANQGISGDRTQHVLWRLEHGALAGKCPPFIALMIGTNNLPHDTAGDIAIGIEVIVERIQDACPASTVLLHAVPPRGIRPDNLMRAKVIEINARIRMLSGQPGVRWIDPWSDFIMDDGTLDPDRMAGDGVHFTSGGYAAWATRLNEAIDP